MTAPHKTCLFATLVACVTLAGCGAKVEARLSNGTRLEATSDVVPLAVNQISDATILTAGDKTIKVMPAEVFLDGATVAKIPSSASHLQVARYRNRVCVVADGRIIFDSVRR